MAWIVDAGLNTMCVAATYHSGWFIHPHAPNRRAFMTEGGVCYFRPQASLYADIPLKPIVSRFCVEREWLTEAGELLQQFGLRLVSWTVGTHNTRLGLLHPQFTQHNVFGDSLPHALCPSNPEVQEYLLRLCRDLATNYPMWGLQLESFGWMGFAHGHHHERDMVDLRPLEQDLMGTCVCRACARAAAAAGVDVEMAANAIRNVLGAAFLEAPDRPAGHPQSMAELEQRSPEVGDFNAWRKRAGEQLIAAVKMVALRGTSCRLLLQTGFEPYLKDVADGFACGAYGLAPPEVRETCRAARASVTGRWDGLLQCFLRLGNGVPRSEEQLRELIAAARDGGCNGTNFYNYSEAPPKMLGWLARAMKQPG